MIQIRTAKKEDCKKCEKLSRIKELKTASGRYIPERYFNCFVDKHKMFLVAEQDKEIVGYILGEPMKGNMAHLGLLMVKSKIRGRGVGKMLVAAFLKRCKERKLNGVLLYAPSFNKNTIKFYEEQGFLKGKTYVNFLKER